MNIYCLDLKLNYKIGLDIYILFYYNIYMSNNIKILLNRVKKGKSLSQQDEKTLLNQINNGPFTLEYAAVYKNTRWLEFEEALEDYCDKFNGLFSTNQTYLMLYIKEKIKGPWTKIEKHLDDKIKNQYRQIMIENNFEEYAI